MTHPDEATLTCLRDGEAVALGVREHVESCVPCRHALDDARARARAIENLLGLPEADTERPKAKVRARLDAQRARDRRKGRGLSHLRRAAGILLVATGAASALPGSPVRVWLGIDRQEPSAHDAAVANPTTTPVAPGEAVVLVPAGDGIEVELTEVTAGTEVELTWLPGATAQVAGGRGARYAVADGRARAAAPNGPVRLGIPRSAPRIAVTINGRLVYSGTSEEATVVDVLRTTENGLVFAVPGP